MTDVRAALSALPPRSRDRLRLLLVSDQAERDAAAAALLRHPDGATSPT